MSQVAENRARVTLIALEEPAPGPSPGWVTQRVRITASVDIEEQRNLLSSDLPREYEALVPEVEALTLGEPAEVEASLAAPGRLRVIASDDGIT